MLEIERADTRSRFLDNSLWTCRKTDYRMNERRRGQPQACFGLRYDIVLSGEVCHHIFMFLDSHWRKSRRIHTVWTKGCA